MLNNGFKSKPFSSHAGIGGILSFALGLAGFHISYLKCSPFIPVRTIIIKYIVSWAFKGRVQKHWKTLNRSTRNCADEQAALLMNKIREHDNTMYGRDFKFKDILSVEDFIRQHPLTKYEHYKNYINRVAMGEVGVMSHTKPKFMGKTSGTSGKAKIYPVGTYLEVDVSYAFSCLLAIQSRAGFRPAGPLQMTCNLLTATTLSVTEGGIPVGSMTSFIWTDDVKKLLFTTPPDVTVLPTNPLRCMFMLCSPSATGISVVSGLRLHRHRTCSSNILSRAGNRWSRTSVSVGCPTNPPRSPTKIEWL